jgi:hypothetical protein
MTAKQYFLSVLAAEKELKLIRAKIRHYEDIGFSITGGSMDSPVVSHSRGSSRVEAAAMGIFDATRALEEKAKEYVAVIQRAERLIALLPQERYRQILTLRYLCGWSFRSISDELHYRDEKSVYRAHGWALKKAGEILKGEENNGEKGITQRAEAIEQRP